MSNSLPGFNPDTAASLPRIVIAYLLGYHGQAVDQCFSSGLNVAHRHVVLGQVAMANLIDLCEAWCVAADQDPAEHTVYGVRLAARAYAAEHQDALTWLDHLVAANEGEVPTWPR
jgi:hypothetical protein